MCQVASIRIDRLLTTKYMLSDIIDVIVLVITHLLI